MSEQHPNPAQEGSTPTDERTAPRHQPPLPRKPLPRQAGRPIEATAAAILGIVDGGLV